MTTPAIEAVAVDLAAEAGALEALLLPLDERSWSLPTPADGWCIKDQVSHLAYFDDACRVALVEPAAFVADLDAAMADLDGMTNRVAVAHRDLTGAELLTWWGDARSAMLPAARAADPSARVPWFGPSMSVASQLTARLMETWAHGQDIADALGVEREPTDRLRHVAFLGVRTLPNSFQARGLPLPEASVRVELVAPSGESWDFGPADAADRLRGPALDFALAVTQRRHPADLALVSDGPVARQWLEIAQAFAGPPGAGRRPGQFAGAGL